MYNHRFILCLFKYVLIISALILAGFLSFETARDGKNTKRGKCSMPSRANYYDFLEECEANVKGVATTKAGLELFCRNQAELEGYLVCPKPKD